jgi:hypothetical protein
MCYFKIHVCINFEIYKLKYANTFIKVNVKLRQIVYTRNAIANS